MRNRFDRELDELNSQLIDMGNLCFIAISQATSAIKTTDKDLAAQVIEEDAHIDQAERDIERMCLKLLLQQQPVAKDLRTISAALKMITDMERIGDQASDIAEIIATTTTPETPEVPKLYDMSKEAANMVNNAITAYVNKDLTLAGKVEANDDVVDNYFTEIREELIDYIIKNPGSNAAKAIDLIMICKYLERIGDHATNIAEWVVFSITGVHEGHIDTKAPVETKNILKAE